MRVIFPFLLLVFTSCSIFKSHETRLAKKIERQVTNSTVFANSYTGFTLLDPVSGKTMADVNGSKYFTPASNTKILTLATCLTVLGDSVPGLRAASLKQGEETTTYLKPTGDPTFLHPNFAAWQQAYQFLSHNSGPVNLDLNNFKEGRFGPGWAWDDYNESYSAEKSAMPIFGNRMTLEKKDSGWIFLPFNNPDKWGWDLIRPETRKDLPDYFKPLRFEQSNLIAVPTTTDFKAGYLQEIPFKPSDYLLQILLGDTIQGLNLSASFSLTKEEEAEEKLYQPENLVWQTIYNTPIDTVLRLMMYQSDNFIAEQMLLVCAGEKLGPLHQKEVINWMLDSILIDLPQRPKWVDGSGLSRYNLMSPQSLASMLGKLWKSQSRERLLSLFPVGGVQGTLADWYGGKDGKPYVYAKTGSMSGVQCLSGYLICKSGKVLIFSFMHNNFVGPGKPWKAEMQRILEAIHDQY